VAVVRAIMDAKDAFLAAKELKRKIYENLPLK
ncbi:thiamine phosphate synthase, partial [Campylobacter jejuni]|nr:thiamine phosphate synthase [Campylobacter jejuni]